MKESVNSEIIGKLSQVFGAQKAEWLGPMLFDLFAEPSYFPQMSTARPCVLVGGRGTGKTTVLRGLSYEGQYALQKKDDTRIKDWPYYGLYYRVDTNRVSAFQGPELTEGEWVRRFAHYINLLMCIQIMRFLEWYQMKTGTSNELDLAARRHVASTLHIKLPNSNSSLLELLQLGLAQFEGYINNVAATKGPELSMQGAPVQSLLEAVNRQPMFQNKLFFFLIDEYENLQDYQQRLMNTLIKHSGELYTFKIGVRELGWRVHNTLNENEQLISPADYIRIDIADPRGDFESFAYKVCQDRLALVVAGGQDAHTDIRELLPGLSEEEEAKLQGIEKQVSPILEELRDVDEKGILNNMSLLSIYLLGSWARSQQKPLVEVFKDYEQNRRTWGNRLSNYKHALLYTLAKGRSGIRKYYAGWDTFVQVSGRNIRYLLQLVEESLSSHLRNGLSLADFVSPDTQTISSQKVGRTNLTELEGLSVRGAKLTKLLLGLGRIFGVMAESPEGHAPEVNQFEVVVGNKAVDINEVNDLLTAAVMHLALLRWSGSKPADEGDTRDWDYMVHPIYAPFFNFSYRRKRKLKLTTFQLLEIVTNPKQAIRTVLAASNRKVDEPLPEQLRLFEMYYADKT
jgi:hypothetical protein